MEDFQLPLLPSLAPVKFQDPNKVDSCISNIIDLCEKHVFSQTSSVQGIVNITSQITGSEYYSNQIIGFCNQIISETLQSSHSIINICKTFSYMDILNENHDLKRSIKELTDKYSNLEASIANSNGTNHDVENVEKTVKKRPRKSLPLKIKSEMNDDVDNILKVNNSTHPVAETSGNVKDYETSDNEFGLDDKRILGMLEDDSSDGDNDIDQMENPDWSAHWKNKQKKRSVDDEEWDENTNDEMKDEDDFLEDSDDLELEGDNPDYDNDSEDPDFLIEDEMEPGETTTNLNPKSPRKSRIPKPPKTPKESKTPKTLKDPKIPKTSKTGKQPKVKEELHCSVCDKKFTNRQLFEKHELSHKYGCESKGFQCDICGYKHLYQSEFKNHLRTHTGERPFVCEICGNAYALMSTLKGHQLTHLDYKPEACNICDYRCRSRKELRVHILIHSTEKNFQCSECGKSFSRGSYLKTHSRSHTDEYPFPCQVCPKRFRFKNHLRRHETIHKGEMKYSCRICGKQSRQKYNITVHMRTHHGEKPYSCDLCEKRFAHNLSQKQHRINCLGKIRSLMGPALGKNGPEMENGPDMENGPGMETKFALIGPMGTNEKLSATNFMQIPAFPENNFILPKDSDNIV